MFNLIVILMSLLISIHSFACVNGKGILPENDLYLGVDYKPINGGVTEVQFNSVLDRVENIYGGIIRSYGGQLKMNRLWSDGTVNASANRQGSTYVVNMYGGLARHQAITEDAFALVACHEVGHHIGGVPRYTQRGGEWASVEGQSDYFATSKCLRKLFASDNNVQIVSSMNVDPLVESKCNSQFSDANDQAICKRISLAGLSSASLFADMSNQKKPAFNTPDNSKVSSTYESHPQYQCRLDTYFEGAICEVQDTVEIGQNDPNVGTCNRKAQQTEGVRPLCWFKPGSGGGTTNPPIGDVATTPTVNGQTVITVRNPSQQIPIAIDVRMHSGVYGFAIEFSKPNQIFANPNSSEPDRMNGLKVEVYQGTNGTYRLVPMRTLPGFGAYQVRVIALDRNKKPVSKNSDSLEIFLEQ